MQTKRQLAIPLQTLEEVFPNSMNGGNHLALSLSEHQPFLESRQRFEPLYASSSRVAFCISK